MPVNNGMIIAECEQMRDIVRMVDRVAPTDLAVLITGETGVGKEVVARMLHSRSRRHGRQFVDVNCAALPEHLVESELFGHEKGAFSGAECAKAGMFELADGGTIFLDEIGELEERMQAKLLRVLDGAPYYRLGGTRKITVDVRIVAATNRVLAESIRTGKFRLDLYHRISELEICVPPLRERPQDVVALAEHFLGQHDNRCRLSGKAMEEMLRYHWPGNIRELRNVISRAVLLAQNDEIGPAELRLSPERRRGMAQAAPVWRLDQMVRHFVSDAMAQTGGHQQKAAELLGISTRTLSRKLKLYAAEQLVD